MSQQVSPFIIIQHLFQYVQAICWQLCHLKERKAPSLTLKSSTLVVEGAHLPRWNVLLELKGIILVSYENKYLDLTIKELKLIREKWDEKGI